MSGILGFSASLGKPPKPVSSPTKSPRRRDDPKAIPVDLWIEIFSRLSAKDIASCRCVSKLWSSVLRRHDFSELFLRASSTRPRLLFALLHKNKWIFFSASQALNPQLNTSPLVPSYHMCFPTGLSCPSLDEICVPVRGLVCRKTGNPMIFNPSTGKYLTLPRATEKVFGMKTLLGYDPIDKLFKVLNVSEDFSCLVSTLGTRGVNWRMIECSIPHKPVQAEILIGGVLYYLAQRIGYQYSLESYVLVAFDVRLQKFKFIDVGLEFWYGTLVNYKGKLGVIWPGLIGLHERTERFKLWLLEDVDEVKWSKIFYTLPDNWSHIVANTWLSVVKMTDAGDIVMSTPYLNDPHYIVYFNVVKNTLVRLEIQFKIAGKDVRYAKAYTFIEHVENVGRIDLIP